MEETGFHPDRDARMARKDDRGDDAPPAWPAPWRWGAP
jgi:hypothetical protein